MGQGSNAIPARGWASFINVPRYVVAAQANSDFSEKASVLDRNASIQIEPDRLNNEIHVKILRLGTGSENVPFVGNSTQCGSDKASNIRKVEEIQSSLSKKTKFTKDVEQSIEVTFQLLEHYNRQNNLHSDQMANILMTVLDRPARLFPLKHSHGSHLSMHQSNDVSRLEHWCTTASSEETPAADPTSKCNDWGTYYGYKKKT